MTWKTHKGEIRDGRWRPQTKTEPVETMAAHTIEQRGVGPSKLAPGYMVSEPDSDTMRCPACGLYGPMLRHWEHCKCSCGLHMEKTGNCITIWNPEYSE